MNKVEKKIKSPELNKRLNENNTNRQHLAPISGRFWLVIFFPGYKQCMRRLTKRKHLVKENFLFLTYIFCIYTCKV